MIGHDWSVSRLFEVFCKSIDVSRDLISNDSSWWIIFARSLIFSRSLIFHCESFTQQSQKLSDWWLLPVISQGSALWSIGTFRYSIRVRPCISRTLFSSAQVVEVLVPRSFLCRWVNCLLLWGRCRNPWLVTTGQYLTCSMIFVSRLI